MGVEGRMGLWTAGMEVSLQKGGNTCGAGWMDGAVAILEDELAKGAQVQNTEASGPAAHDRRVGVCSKPSPAKAMKFSDSNNCAYYELSRLPGKGATGGWGGGKKEDDSGG
eukprot:1148596-Pelagomonas_calceolata.AAC.3